METVNLVTLILSAAVLIFSIILATARSNRQMAFGVLAQGMLLGVLYLSLNLEFLAILQWVLCILFSILGLLVAAEVGVEKKKIEVRRWMGPLLVIGGWVGVGVWLDVLEKAHQVSSAAMDSGFNPISSRIFLGSGVSVLLALLLVFLVTIGLAYIVRRRFEGESL